MFPNACSLKKVNSQRGFLLPLALFIIVVMGVLALTISRTATQSQSVVMQEFMSLQSFYAAESGAQRALQILFFPDASARQGVDNRCMNLNQNINFSFSGQGQLCSAQISCSCVYPTGATCEPAIAANYSNNSPVTTSYYTITSLGSCGADMLRAQRTLNVGSFMEQE